MQEERRHKIHPKLLTLARCFLLAALVGWGVQPAAAVEFAARGVWINMLGQGRLDQHAGIWRRGQLRQKGPARQ